MRLGIQLTCAYVRTHGPTSRLTSISAVLGGVFVLGALSNFGRVWYINQAGQRIVARLRSQLWVSSAQWIDLVLTVIDSAPSRCKKSPSSTGIRRVLWSIGSRQVSPHIHVCTHVSLMPMLNRHGAGWQGPD